MKTNLKAALSLIALTCAGAATAGRDIECAIPREAPTVNGIRSLKFRQADGEGSGRVILMRDGKAIQVAPASMADELQWYESEMLDPHGNYSVEEVTTLKKTRANGASEFVLVKVRRTLSGDHCDGYHACESKLEIVDRVPVACTDSYDLLPSSPERCPPEQRNDDGDCE